MTQDAACVWAWGRGRFALGLHKALDGTPWHRAGQLRPVCWPFRMEDQTDAQNGKTVGWGFVLGKWLLTGFWSERASI